MEKQLLFENEEILLRPNNTNVSLTNRLLRKSTGKEYMISMHLESISTIEMQYKSWPLILVLGVLLVLMSIFLGFQNPKLMPPVLILGPVCIFAYFSSRFHINTISSNGGAKMNIQTRE